MDTKKRDQLAHYLSAFEASGAIGAAGFDAGAALRNYESAVELSADELVSGRSDGEVATIRSTVRELVEMYY